MLFCPSNELCVSLNTKFGRRKNFLDTMNLAILMIHFSSYFYLSSRFSFLPKGEVMKTRGGGTSVQFTDIETLKKTLEAKSNGAASIKATPKKIGFDFSFFPSQILLH